jgi:hypothetical protein
VLPNQLPQLLLPIPSSAAQGAGHTSQFTAEISEEIYEPREHLAGVSIAVSFKTLEASDKSFVDDLVDNSRIF